MSVGWGCINGVEVELWGECYNIETTTTLNLYNNQLTGEIPTEIGNLTNLTELYLHNNQLTGEIPPEIGNLTNLTYLYLNGNDLTGEIPPEIGDLTNLSQLYLFSNLLTGEIPPEIGNLTNLTSLKLYSNQLTGSIPSEIGTLTNLNRLYLYNNQLRGGIPSSIGNLNNLEFLLLNNNQLSGLIPENLCDITYVNVGVNNLCPPYPECLSEDVVGNQNTSNCEEPPLCDENMYWSDCGLPFYCNPTCINPDPLPECDDYCEIGCFCNEGYIFSNDLFGECIVIENCSEPSLCNEETEVELLGECYNQSDLNVLQSFIDLNQSFNGEEPLEIGDQEWYNTRLTYLGLGNRSLTTIPDNIGNLNHLEYLFLSSNQFSILPESVGNLSSLKFLFLSHNQFSILPESIGNLSSLETLYLHSNQLFILPDTICNLSDCYIYVNDNQLCPPYPDCLTEGYIGYQDTSECEEIDLGDINGDDSIDILDVVMLLNYILSGDTSELDGADINNDGEVNILDVVQLVNIILGVTENTVTDIDGNVYETVQIGGQLWMAENLKVTHYQNSEDIPYIYNDPQYGAYINYNNNDDNVAVYGRLYNWFAVNDERGLCPDNWHVPSDDEFKSLEMYLGMSESEANGEGLRGTDEGGQLKEEGDEHWNSPNTGATNETGFTALPGGNRRYETYTNQEIFSGLNRYGFFWSSSEVYTVNAWYRVFSYDYSESNRYHLSKANAFSVRCVED
jgi:uncharacterized protein (TIGR02145 family)